MKASYDTEHITKKGTDLFIKATKGITTVAKALAFALAMGVLGGFLPALRAARLGIVKALRAS